MDPNISDERLSEYKEAFGLFDRDSDGAISASELGDVMRSLGETPTNAEIEAIIRELDTDGSGTIDFPEFLTLMTKHSVKDQDTEADLVDAFGVFDSDHNGYISATELRNVMTTLGEKMSDEEVDDMLKEADLDNDGLINYAEFSKVMFHNE